MVSIIISAHIDRGWLDRAILSAVNQDFKDKEVILSSDGNWQLKEFADKYGIAFCCSPKYGHSMALNNAVKMCSGTWIKEVHDDDELLPTCISDLMQGVKDCDLVYANAINILNGVEDMYKSPDNITIGSFLPVITNPLHWATVLFRRTAFINSGGFDINLRVTEDYEFNIRMLKKQYVFKYVDKYVVKYLKHENSMTGINHGELRQKESNYISKKHRI